jgi:hypothetical protein
MTVDPAQAEVAHLDKALLVAQWALHTIVVAVVALAVVVLVVTIVHMVVTASFALF